MTMEPTMSPPVQPGGPRYQSDRDDDHLRMLSICYYIWGGLMALFSLCPSLYVVMGVAMAVNPSSFADGGETPPAFLGWIIVAIGLAVMLFGFVLAALSVYTGQCLTRKKNRVFCLVMAGISCLSVPLGTILGVFTIVVLVRDSVVAKFAANRAPVEGGQTG